MSRGRLAAVVLTVVSASAAVPGGASAAGQIDVAQLVASGDARVTASPFDIGEPANVFDGDITTLYRSAEVNPAFIQVAFDRPVTFEEFRVHFSHNSRSPAYRWTVEAAANVADLESRAGSYVRAVPLTDAEDFVFSSVTLASPVTANVVRLTVTRLNSDNFVHIDEWQMFGTTQFALLGEPRGIAVDAAGRSYVAETRAGRISVFGPSGGPLRTIGSPGDAPGQLRSPHDVALDGSGRVYVADTGHSRVVRYLANGAFDRVLVSSLSSPHGVAVDAGRGHLYVADTGNRRVMRFNLSGTRDGAWSGDGIVGVTGSLRRDHSGFDTPNDIAVDPTGGQVNVADAGNDRIEVFDQRGSYVRTHHGVYQPNALAFDRSGNLYIAGTDPNDSYTYADGRLRFLARGDAVISRHYTGGLDDISREQGGVAVAPSGDVLFTDTRGNRVVRTARSFPVPLSALRVVTRGTTVTFQWRTRRPAVGVVRLGATAALGGEASEQQATTQHEITVRGLTPDRLLHYRVSFPDSFDGSRRFIRPDVVNTGGPRGRMLFLRLKAAGVIYTDVQGGPGYTRMDPTTLTAARDRFRRIAEFYWRNSGFRLWLDIQIVQVDRDIQSDLFDAFGALGGDLAAAGFGPGSNLDAAWAAAPLAFGNFGGASTLFGRTVGMAEWATQDDFPAIHEVSHSIDSIYASVGQLKYEFNHGLWAVPRGVGHDFSINAQILRNMLPGNFAATTAPFTKRVTAPDADRDSVPDSSSSGLTRPLAITEATLGSSTARFDTDGDGLSDLEEATALVTHGTNPRNADSDGDGVRDGVDTNPAYRMTDRIRRATPAVDGSIGAGEGWTRMTNGFGFSNDKLVDDNNSLQARTATYAAWDDRNIYFALRGPPSQTRLFFDGGADNRFVGADNYEISLFNNFDVLQLRVNAGIPDVFRMVDADGQFSELFDTDPLFTDPYQGRPFFNQPGEGAGFPGRLATEGDLRFARGGSGDASVWEIAIPRSRMTTFRPFSGKQVALSMIVNGDRLFETDRDAVLRLVP